jgi:hypothetical protein
MKRAGTTRSVRASTIDDTTDLGDELILLPINIPSFNESLQFLLVSEPIMLGFSFIGLHRSGPIEHSGNPLEISVFLSRTDLIRSTAEINIGIKRIATFICSSFSRKIIQLTEITDTGGLNDTS